jgi:hypothetical protein
MVALGKYEKRKKAPDCTVFALGLSSKTLSVMHARGLMLQKTSLFAANAQVF